MRITKTIDETRTARAAMGRVAMVPTMGALHEGHLSLMRRAREIADDVVVSIFVNPTQFAPHEDLERYPRPIERDLELCEREGVSLVFNPSVDVVYPPEEPETVVNVPSLGDHLEGAHRPGFFVGVCRVVAKLLNIVRPDAACFGMKDYQQLRVIEAMAGALCTGCTIAPCPIVREPDGLAMSSRNVYLDTDQRKRALGLSKALDQAAAMIDSGSLDPAEIEAAMARALIAHECAVDYAVVRDARTLAPMDIVNPSLEPLVCLIAARVDAVRLIDNREVGG